MEQLERRTERRTDSGRGAPLPAHLGHPGVLSVEKEEYLAGE